MDVEIDGGLAHLDSRQEQRRNLSGQFINP
jgi:hypothetical protein